MASSIKTVSHATPYPPMSGCPDCRTIQMNASPAAPGSCPDRGAKLEIFPASRIATEAMSTPARAL